MSQDRFSKGPATRCAAIPYRVREDAVEVLLVTRRSGREWTIPKGKVDRALGPRESARLEAREKAGVDGEIAATPFDEYRHGGDEEPLVQVFLLRVTEEVAKWENAKKRERAWLPIHTAAYRVDDHGLTRVLTTAAARLAAQHLPDATAADLTVAGGAPPASRYPLVPATATRATTPPPRERHALISIRLVVAGLAAVALVALGASALLSRGRRDRTGDGRDSISAVSAGVEKAPRDTPAAGGALAAGDSVCRVEAAGIGLSGEVSEASGIAAGLNTPGVLWTHNDSGDPLIYAFAADGRALGRVRVTGATVKDWEDIAAGPCAGGGCLYLADIGDNAASRTNVTVYRVAEPAPTDGETRPAEAFHATYPDGPHDAEAMFVLPDGGLYIVTKGETGSIAIYRFPQPLRAGATARLERVTELRATMAPRRERITGASASPDGQWFALRTLDAVDLYRSRDLLGGNVANPLRVDVRALKERQGEGVGWGPNGTLYLSSEGGKKNTPGTLARLTCTPS